jgi:subtilase family serine protease
VRPSTQQVWDWPAGGDAPPWGAQGERIAPCREGVGTMVYVPWKARRAARGRLAAWMVASTLAVSPLAAVALGVPTALAYGYGGALRVATTTVRAGSWLSVGVPAGADASGGTWTLVSPDSRLADDYPLFTAHGSGQTASVFFPAGLPAARYILVHDTNGSEYRPARDYVSRVITVTPFSGAFAQVIESTVTPFEAYLHYAATSVYGQNVRGQNQTIALYELSDVRNSDISTFDAIFGLPALELVRRQPQGRVGIVSAYASEATMDVEWAHAMAPDARIVLYIYRRPSVGSLAHAAELAAEAGDAAFSSSISYHELFGSGSYPGRVQTFDESTVQTAVQEGLGMFAAAGDHGEVTPSDFNSPNHFSWPASNPWVVAVGGTQLNLLGLESYWDQGERNGTLWAGAYGYTGYVAQDWETQEYTRSGLGFDLFRYMPDVSFLAWNAIGILNGKLTDWGGTSLASPAWAGIWALVRQYYRAQRGADANLLPAPELLYDLANDTQLPPAYLTQTPGTAAPYNPETGFGAPDVANLVYDAAQY